MNDKSKNTQYSSFLNTPFLLLIAYNILFCMSYGMISPILMGYLVERGISLGIAGVVAGVVSITSLLIRPLSGHFTDQMNKKKLLVFASIMMGIAMVGLASSNHVPFMILFRIFQGIGFSINGTCCIAMATAYMPQDRLGEGIGYFGVANIVSTSVAPMIGIELADRIGYINTIFAAGASVIIASLFMLAFKYYEYSAEPGTRRTVLDTFRSIKLESLFSLELLPVALFVASFSFANSIVSNYLALLCQERGLTGYSIYFTINAVIMIITRPFLGKLSDKKGLSVVLYPAFVIAAIAMVMIAGGNVIGIIYVAAVFKALGQGSGQPALQTECLKKLGAQRRGLATSTFYVGSDVANGLGPVVGGLVVSEFGYASIFNLSAVFLVMAFIGYHFYVRKEKMCAR